MIVMVYPYHEKYAHGNIVWTGRFPMRAGRFPMNHPVAPGWRSDDPAQRVTMQFGRGPGLDLFRGRGYWASCFPDGDGITFKPLDGQDDDRQRADVRECFGWEVKP